MTMTEHHLLTDVELEHDRKLSLRSCLHSRTRLEAALRHRCPDCGAAASLYCFDFTRSKVRGLCSSRYRLGTVVSIGRRDEWTSQHGAQGVER
jgi:hypothetical protein